MRSTFAPFERERVSRFRRFFLRFFSVISRKGAGRGGFRNESGRSIPTPALRSFCILTAVLFALYALRFSLAPSARAVEGTLTISGASQTLTGDVTAGRLVDQANSSYYIDPAASGNSLITAGAASVSGNLVLNAGATISTTNMQPLTLGSSTTGVTTVTSGNKLQLQAGGTGTGSTGTGSIYFLNSSGTTKGRFETITDVPSSGDGADGAITVSSNTNINTTNLIGGRSCADGGDMVAYSVSSVTDSDTVVLSSTPASGCLAAGDEMLLINLQGDGTDAVNVGNWEILEISSISTSTINFTTAKKRFYGDDADDDANIGTAATNQRVMLQRVPNYTNVTVNSGITLQSSDWDGTKFGVLLFKANGTVTVTGNINQDIRGYRGGASTAVSGTPTPGESYIKQYSAQASDANTACGGGSGKGGGAGSGGNGGSGGHATAGEGPSSSTFQNSTSGRNWGDTALAKLGFGCGGSSASYYSTFTGAAGGDGGGVVAIFASTINVTGTVTANGGHGVFTSGGFGSGAGAGGTIWLSATSLSLGNQLITNKGGLNYNGANYTWQDSGTAGLGYIRLDYSAQLLGITNPAPQFVQGQTYGTLFAGRVDAQYADIAEYYVTGDKTINQGDVVTIGKALITDREGNLLSSRGALFKATKPYDSKLIGIISTNPGLVIGGSDQGVTADSGSLDGTSGKADKRMLALAGRVPVKIDPDSPPIAVGDFLTSSAKAGLAAKATRPGYVVARALASWQPSGPDRIEAFLQLAYYMGDIDPWGNFRTLEVDTLKVNKALEVGGVNVMDEINNLKQRLNLLESK